MSATPEEIAEWLCDFARYMRLASPEGDPFSNARLTKAAALIRAQSEREKVLVEALRGLLSQTLSNQAPNGLKAVQAARAAIAKATGAA